MDTRTVLLLCCFLLCLSAFFSGSETALFSLQPVDREALGERGRRNVDYLLDRPRRALASILIGNEFVNLTLTTVTAAVVFRLFEDHKWLNVVIVTPVILVFGEVLPKTLAFRFNRTLAPVIATPLRYFSIAVSPLRVVVTWVAEQALRLMGGSSEGTAVLEEEHFQLLLDQGREAGTVQALEQEMIQKVFQFGELQVSRLMTPRSEVFRLNMLTPWKELLESVHRAGFSRVPIWQGSSENIIGILLVKDLLPHLGSQGRKSGLTPRQLQKRLRPAHFVPTSKRAEDLLADFRNEKFHMALVVDEHGVVVGVVTLDDLLAELVGELVDELDMQPTDVTEVAPKCFTVRASMGVDDFSDLFGITLPQGDFTTVGGFVFSQLGELPARDDEVAWEGLQLKVSGIEERRITELYVTQAEVAS
jgi:CBS domain containing-hemolysin-like protein